MVGVQQQGGGTAWHWQWGDTVSCDRTVFALAEFQDANDVAPMLYAAGRFTVVDGVSADYVARWDPNAPGGPSWAPVGPNDPNNHPGSFIYALTVYDPNSGSPALCAAGEGGVYKWQDNTWSRFLSDSSPYYVLAEYEDPNGVCLYAGGDSYLKRWDGTGNWECVWETGAGNVEVLHVHDEGPGDGFSGPGLYVGGQHPYGGSHLARYDGTWHEKWPVGDHVFALETFDDGLGARPALYVGGHFHTAGALPDYQDSDYIAR